MNTKSTSVIEFQWYFMNNFHIKLIFLPDNLLKLIILFMADVDKITSSKTGTLPPTRPVLPACTQTAISRLLQYLRISETCSVVFGLSTYLLKP